MIRSRFVLRVALLIPFVLLAVLAARTNSLTPVQAAPAAPRLVFAPATLTLDGDAEIAVRVEGVSDLYALDLTVHFDSDDIAVDAIEPGDFLSADFVQEQSVDQTAGAASLVYTQLAPNQPQSGSGAVAVLALRSTGCTDTTSLTLADVILSDADGNRIDHTLESGTVRCGAAGASTPRVYIPLLAGD